MLDLPPYVTYEENDKLIYQKKNVYLQFLELEDRIKYKLKELCWLFSSSTKSKFSICYSYYYIPLHDFKTQSALALEQFPDRKNLLAKCTHAYRHAVRIEWAQEPSEFQQPIHEKKLWRVRDFFNFKSIFQ